jgi:hypothetical protein
VLSTKFGDELISGLLLAFVGESTPFLQRYKLGYFGQAKGKDLHDLTFFNF